MNYNPANYPWATVKYWSVCIHLSILFGSIYIIIVCLFIFFKKAQPCAAVCGAPGLCPLSCSQGCGLSPTWATDQPAGAFGPHPTSWQSMETPICSRCPVRRGWLSVEEELWDLLLPTTWPN